MSTDQPRPEDTRVQQRADIFRLVAVSKRDTPEGAAARHTLAVLGQQERDRLARLSAEGDR